MAKRVRKGKRGKGREREKEEGYEKMRMLIHDPLFLPISTIKSRVS